MKENAILKENLFCIWMFKVSIEPFKMYVHAQGRENILILRVASKIFP